MCTLAEVGLLGDDESAGGEGSLAWLAMVYAECVCALYLDCCYDWSVAV